MPIWDRDRFFYGLDLALYKAIVACIVRATSYVIEPPVLSKLSVGSAVILPPIVAYDAFRYTLLLEYCLCTVYNCLAAHLCKLFDEWKFAIIVTHDQLVIIIVVKNISSHFGYYHPVTFHNEAILH